MPDNPPTRVEFAITAQRFCRRHELSYPALALLLAVARSQGSSVTELAETCMVCYHTVDSHIRRHSDLFIRQVTSPPRPDQIRLSAAGSELVAKLLMR